MKITLPPGLLQEAAEHIAARPFDARAADGKPREFFVTYFYSPKEPNLLLPGYR